MERDIGEEIIEKLQDILRKTQDKNKLANQMPAQTPKEQKYTPEDIEKLMESIYRRMDFIIDALDKIEKKNNNGKETIC